LLNARFIINCRPIRINRPSLEHTSSVLVLTSGGIGDRRSPLSFIIMSSPCHLSSCHIIACHWQSRASTPPANWSFCLSQPLEARTLATLTHALTNRTYTPRGGLVKVRGHCRRLPGHRQVTGHGKGQPSGHTVAAHSSLTVLPCSGVGQCSIFPS